MKNIYLTSTFTNQWNVEFNPQIGEALEKRGITCYLPHRDTNQEKKDEIIFNQDIKGIEESSLILAIALNESPNWGAELGYAYGIKKQIIILTNENHSVPLICNGMKTEIVQVKDLNQIEEYIDLLVEKIKKLL